MTKFVGTGKDPRAPQGVDLDIPDARPHEADLVEKSGIGTRVPDDETHLVPHTGHEIIEAEGGDPYGTIAGAGVGGHEDRVAARVESTSAYDGPVGETVEATDGSGRAPEDSADAGATEGGEGLSNLKREELNARASEAGVEDPESLPNRDAVIEAIRAKETGAE